MPSPPRLTITGLNKRFGPVEVLRDIDLELRAGEVFALVGENGAGKSTLCKIVAGELAPDRGTMTLHGTPYTPRSKRDGLEAGIRMVMQELNLVANLSVAESIFVDRLPHRCGWIDYPQLRRDARGALQRVGLDVDPDRAIRTLGVGQQQLVEIAAGLSRRCDLLILDEPTAALTDPEIDHLFERIAELKAAGTTVLYISHRMEEIRRIADRIGVLRDGRLVAAGPVADFTMDDIVRLMVGRDLPAEQDRARRRPGDEALRVANLRCPPAVRDVSFALHRGEILGMAGLMGAGRTEAVRLLFGADRGGEGKVYLHGSSEPARIRSPRQAVRQGIALLTEDRKEQGLMLPLTIRSNVCLPSLARVARRGGWLSVGREAAAGGPWVSKMAVRCRDIEQPVGELSGGNQQKTVLAKWMMRNCDVLLFDEPTRGIDVGARFEIYRLLDELAANGKAILMVSSDLTELMMLADRIAVMSAGILVDTFERGDWSQDRIMAAALREYAGSGRHGPAERAA